MHNYRGSGGRGQPSASAGAPEPGVAGFRGVPARRSVADCRIPSPVVRRPRTGGRAVPFPGRRPAASGAAAGGVSDVEPHQPVDRQGQHAEEQVAATSRFPRTRTCRPPYESLRAEFARSTLDLCL